MQRCVSFQVFGKVQGVFFRKFTRAEALKLGLKGWVRNCADGSVEGVASGSEESVSSFLNWLHQGSPICRVLKVTSKQIGLEHFD